MNSNQIYSCQRYPKGEVIVKSVNEYFITNKEEQDFLNFEMNLVEYNFQQQQQQKYANSPANFKKSVKLEQAVHSQSKKNPQPNKFSRINTTGIGLKSRQASKSIQKSNFRRTFRSNSVSKVKKPKQKPTADVDQKTSYLIERLRKQIIDIQQIMSRQLKQLGDLNEYLCKSISCKIEFQRFLKNELKKQDRQKYLKKLEKVEQEIEMTNQQIESLEVRRKAFKEKRKYLEKQIQKIAKSDNQGKKVNVVKKESQKTK